MVLLPEIADLYIIPSDIEPSIFRDRTLPLYKKSPASVMLNEKTYNSYFP